MRTNNGLIGVSQAVEKKLMLWYYLSNVMHLKERSNYSGKIMEWKNRLRRLEINVNNVVCCGITWFCLPALMFNSTIC